MDYFIPSHVKGYFATPEQRAAAEKAGRDPERAGLPYQFFRGIHHVPDVIANSHYANDLGIVPVEEMADSDWAQLGLDKDAWMAEHRPAPAKVDEAPEMAVDGRNDTEAADLPSTAAKAPTAV